MKKYEFTDETIKTPGGTILRRIKAIIDIGNNVKAGDLGGFIEKEENLAHEGEAWVFGNAQVNGNARVFGDAKILGNARVYGNAMVSCNAQISGESHVFDNARVHDTAKVFSNALVYGDAKVYGNAMVYGNATVSDSAKVYSGVWVSNNAKVYGNASVYGNSHISGNARVSGSTNVYGDTKISDYAYVSGNAWVYGNARIYGNAKVDGNALISGNAEVCDNARVSGNVKIYDHAMVCDTSLVFGGAIVSGKTRIFGDSKVCSNITEKCELEKTDTLENVKITGWCAQIYERGDDEEDDRVFWRTSQYPTVIEALESLVEHSIFVFGYSVIRSSQSRGYAAPVAQCGSDELLAEAYHDGEPVVIAFIDELKKWIRSQFDCEMYQGKGPFNTDFDGEVFMSQAYITQSQLAELGYFQR